MQAIETQPCYVHLRRNRQVRSEEATVTGTFYGFNYRWQLCR